MGPSCVRLIEMPENNADSVRIAGLRIHENIT